MLLTVPCRDLRKALPTMPPASIASSRNANATNVLNPAKCFNFLLRCHNVRTREISRAKAKRVSGRH
jgi:hypothetical protein